MSRLPAPHLEATTIDPEALRILIQTKLADGRLPRSHPTRVWGGPGKGEVCEACQELVSKNQMVMDGVVLPEGQRALPLHIACFWIWESEVRRYLRSGV